MSRAVARGWAVLRLAAAGLGLAAILAQIDISLARPTFRLANFFSFFTIESNVIAIVAFAVGAVSMWRGVRVRWIGGLRGAATFYMLITGVVYNVLLRGLEESLQTPTPWINEVLHLVIPIAIVLDFLADRTVHRLSPASALSWVIYPILYLAYTLIRGPIVSWYPYPFLDPRPNGYGVVLLTCLIIAVVAVLGCQLLAWSTRTRRAAAPGATPSQPRRASRGA